MGVRNKLKKNRGGKKNVYFYWNSAKMSKYFARWEQECCSAEEIHIIQKPPKASK